MPKTRKKAKSAAPLQSAQGVRLGGIFTRAVSFSEVAVSKGKREPPHDPEHPRADLNLRIGVARGDVGTDKGAEVVLDATIRPDPSKQPYSLQIVMSAVFHVPASFDEKLFDAFCRQNAPLIMWPYLRALASSVTADGKYGAIRLDPVNLAAFLRNDRWRQT